MHAKSNADVISVQNVYLVYCYSCVNVLEADSNSPSVSVRIVKQKALLINDSPNLSTICQHCFRLYFCVVQNCRPAMIWSFITLKLP